MDLDLPFMDLDFQVNIYLYEALHPSFCYTTPYLLTIMSFSHAAAAADSSYADSVIVIAVIIVTAVVIAVLIFLTDLIFETLETVKSNRGTRKTGAKRAKEASDNDVYGPRRGDSVVNSRLDIVENGNSFMLNYLLDPPMGSTIHGISYHPWMVGAVGGDFNPIDGWRSPPMAVAIHGWPYHPWMLNIHQRDATWTFYGHTCLYLHTINQRHKVSRALAYFRLFNTSFSLERRC